MCHTKLASIQNEIGKVVYGANEIRWTVSNQSVRWRLHLRKWVRTYVLVCRKLSEAYFMRKNRFQRTYVMY